MTCIGSGRPLPPGPAAGPGRRSKGALVDLSGSTVVVTGASRGIGKELALRFAKEGARVVAVARDREALAALNADAGVIPLMADLAVRPDIDGLIERAEGQVGPIDVLVNNAGVDATGDFLSAEADDLDRLVRVNLLAPMLLCRQALGGMAQRGRGHIVNVSSIAGVGGYRGIAAYCSSKAGLSHFTAALRDEVRGLGIAITLVELGPVDTDMWEDVSSYGPAQLVANRLQRTKLLNTDKPEKVAKAVVKAVAKGQRHVRRPRRMLPLYVLNEAPRQITEALARGLPNRPDPDRAVLPVVDLTAGAEQAPAPVAAVVAEQA